MAAFEAFARRLRSGGKRSLRRAPIHIGQSCTICAAPDRSGGRNTLHGPASKSAPANCVKDDAEKLAENPFARLPIDLVTTSGSGFDPDILLETALFQVPPLFVFGEPRVHMLALDRAAAG